MKYYFSYDFNYLLVFYRKLIKYLVLQIAVLNYKNRLLQYNFKKSIINVFVR